MTENVEEYPADYNLDEMDEIIEELINNESSVTTDNTAALEGCRFFFPLKVYSLIIKE